MALRATIFKADLQIADLDRGYYADHSLTIARHPSETDERMMVRLVAFACHASPALAFGRGLSTDDEPDLWEKDLTDQIGLWIDVGLPDEKRMLRACGRAEAVRVYAYGGRGVNVWWQKTSGKLERARNLTVVNLPGEQTLALAALAERTMRLQCTIQEGHVWVADAARAIEVVPEVLMSPSDR